MSFAASRDRLQTAIFDRLGEDASWTGQAEPVRVRFVEADTEMGFGEARLIASAMAIRVRRSQVDAPQVGDEVGLIASGRTLRLSQEAQVDRNGVWECPVVEVV